MTHLDIVRVTKYHQDHLASLAKVEDMAQLKGN
jgi:hypothetical protein